MARAVTTPTPNFINQTDTHTHTHTHKPLPPTGDGTRSSIGMACIERPSASAMAVMAEAKRPFVQAEATLLIGKGPMAGVLTGVLTGVLKWGNSRGVERGYGGGVERGYGGGIDSGYGRGIGRGNGRAEPLAKHLSLAIMAERLCVTQTCIAA